VKPINPEMPQIKGDGGEGQNESADQERTRRPINPIDWDTENHIIVIGNGCVISDLGLWLWSPVADGLQETGLPRITSSLVQLWTAPQCAQVNFCRTIFAAGQRFCSIVRPVSVSFEVEGQRTSKLFRSAPAFAFGRRGGSK
jgi:hypothetical protein